MANCDIHLEEVSIRFTIYQWAMVYAALNFAAKKSVDESYRDLANILKSKIKEERKGDGR